MRNSNEEWEIRRFLESIGFVNTVRSAFVFLESEYGMRIVHEEPQWIRYQNARRFMNVVFDRYEIYVTIGIATQEDVRPREDYVTLGEIIRYARGTHTLGLPAFAIQSGSIMVSDRQGVEELVPELAELTETYAAPLLSGDDVLFDRVREAQPRTSGDELQGGAARRYREQAEQAWRDRDYETVERAYTNMLAKLPLIQLHPAERRRLDYAKRRLSR